MSPGHNELSLCTLVKCIIAGYFCKCHARMTSNVVKPSELYYCNAIQYGPIYYADFLHDCSIPNVLVIEILHSCTNPPIRCCLCHRHDEEHLGAVSIRKTVLPGMAIPMLKIRRPNGRLIFSMGIPIPGKDGLYIETGPWNTDCILNSQRHLTDSIKVLSATLDSSLQYDIKFMLQGINSNKCHGKNWKISKQGLQYCYVQILYFIQFFKLSGVLDVLWEFCRRGLSVLYFLIIRAIP